MYQHVYVLIGIVMAIMAVVSVTGNHYRKTLLTGMSHRLNSRFYDFNTPFGQAKLILDGKDAGISNEAWLFLFIFRREYKKIDDQRVVASGKNILLCTTINLGLFVIFLYLASVVGG